MLRPTTNPFRQSITTPDFWDFRFDPDDEGKDKGWAEGFEGGRPIAVPASWNDQFESERDNLGPAWYQTQFDLPWGWLEKDVRLRFGSVNYLAEVWLNGTRLGQHEGGHLPFEFDVTPHLRLEDNLLVVRVDGQLAPDRVPPGKIPDSELDTFGRLNYPDTSFDFFPFCGIHRPVHLSATPHGGLEDLTVTTTIEGERGLVHVRIERMGEAQVTARVSLRGHGVELTEEAALTESGDVAIEVEDPALWSPDSPALYDLSVQLVDGDGTFDRYDLPVGIRTIEVDGDDLLLNGEPVRLTGFGRHEDFPVTGRGFVPAVVVKDYALMKWIGANSFRTSHYPYSERMMDLADRLGFLVIDETPAVGLFFHEQGLEKRHALCRQYIEELIARDKNHPSVIMWSVANEPHSKRPPARPFFHDLTDLVRSLDPTRPVTLVSTLGVREEALEFCDVVCMNRYHGWYSYPAQLDKGVEALSQELDAIHDRFPKPLLLSEFGADTIPGWHAQPSEMFSEEYQTEMLTRYIQVAREKPYVIGEHVWNLCDFKTAQAVHRMGAMNFKGVFTRDRRPKMAAHKLRELWTEKVEEETE